MQDIYFEDIHKAAGHYPYLDFEMHNINYIAHFHEEIELVYVVSGTVSVTTESGTQVLHANDICFFMPGEIHSFVSNEANQLYIFKLFAKNYVEPLDFTLIRLTENVVRMDSPLHNALLSDIQTIAYEAAQKKAGYEFSIRAASNHILMLVARHIPYLQIDIGHKKELATKLVFFKAVNDFIEEKYNEPISLEEISNYCNLSKYYFAHHFKKVTSMSFMEYLTTYRLRKSLDMLILSSDSITSIAAKCGFSNTRSFNRMFKKQFAMTPTEYKKNFTQN